jgi:predicted cupin superfamily sugar epimerase
MAPESELPVIAKQLDLIPHIEGGWYRETWTTGATVHPPGYRGSRSTATAIYYLADAARTSRWHRVLSDELWLWHHGSPLRLSLGGTGASPAEQENVHLGPDIEAGQHPQVLIPANTWQRCRPLGTEHTLVSCVVSPGFDYADFTILES